MSESTKASKKRSHSPDSDESDDKDFEYNEENEEEEEGEDDDDGEVDDEDDDDDDDEDDDDDDEDEDKDEDEEDDDDDKPSKAKKAKKAKGDVPEVHSANKWEEANLGDDDRKAKFLRLMGGAKKEHTGRFVCGEKSTDKTDEDEHSNTRKSDEKLEQKLEAQYKESMTNALKQRDKHHRGLGYHGDSTVDLEGRDKEAAPDSKPPPPHVHDANVDPDVHFVKSHTGEPRAE